MRPSTLMNDTLQGFFTLSEIVEPIRPFSAYLFPTPLGKDYVQRQDIQWNRGAPAQSRNAA
ncbi:MAG: hypothetical protein H0V70_04810 [Ktedonobacteraceae bacterium]|nr:hypothetical protein [Ktedonobacteraceae bacterium]